MKKILIMFFIILSSCTKFDSVKYDIPLFDLLNEAKRTKKPFSVILMTDDCSACYYYINNIILNNKDNILSGYKFNIINTSLRNNNWYKRWINNPDSPITLSFNEDGKLISIIAGSNNRAIDCLKQVKKGELGCVYTYKDFGLEIDIKEGMEYLNDVLNVYINKEKYENFYFTINELKQKYDYPFLDFMLYEYLKNENPEDALNIANSLIKYVDLRKYSLYKDIYNEIHSLRYNGQIEYEFLPCIDLPEEIVISGCKLDVPKIFSVEVKNIGIDSVSIFDIMTSCDCVELYSQKSYKIGRDSLVNIEFGFIADRPGEFLREIIFLTDGKIPIKKMVVKASTL